MSRPPDRIGAYGRYLALVDEQSRALEAEDIERFGELSEERERLAGSIDRIAAGGAAEAARVDELLRACVAADARVRARLQTLRDVARDRLRLLEARRPQIAPYLAAPSGSRLDRRS